VRVIDEEGKNLGILPLEEAINLAKEKGLTLVQVTEKVFPPVCKITDYGKYLYQEEKKERKAGSKKSQGLKNIRLAYNISLHDLGIKAKAAGNFLKRGNNVRIELILRGRERSLLDFAKKKIEQFLEMVQKECPLKIERELKKEAKGFTLIISRKL
jgi:translation initiation factor IF-3